MNNQELNTSRYTQINSKPSQILRQTFSFLHKMVASIQQKNVTRLTINL